MKFLSFHPAANTEITEAVQYYETRTSGLSRDLLDEVEKAFNLILATPEAYPQIGKRTRRILLWRFPYYLVYAVQPDRIRVVAFAHQKRRPFYWRKRLKDTSTL